MEYLRGRMKEVADELEHSPGLFDSLRSWPPGANGPIAVAAYESLVFRAERAVFNLRAALMRTDREPLVVNEPEGPIPGGEEHPYWCKCQRVCGGDQ